MVNLLELEKELLPANVGDPAARTGMEQSFDGAIQCIKCIAGVHDLLTMHKFGSTCEIGEIAGTVCEFYQNCAQTTLEAEPVRVPYAKAVSVALVINELVSNSIKHNQRLGRPLAVSIRVTQHEPEYREALKLRQIWCEGTFAAQKRDHNLTRVLRRGLEAAEDRCLLSATALNLKRMIKYTK